MMNTTGIIFVAISWILTITRFFMPVRPVSTFSIFGTYEAVAHLFCGGMLGAYLVSKRYVYLVAFLAIVASELFMAIIHA